mgnify:CR=1 FL=1
MSESYNPWQRLMQSRKFWLLMMDTVISLVLHFAAVVKPEALEHVKFAVATLQPVFIVLITAIAVEDAALNLSNRS